MQIIQDGNKISITIVHMLPGICVNEWIANDSHKILLKGDDLLKDRDILEFLEFDPTWVTKYKKIVGDSDLDVTTYSIEFLKECASKLSVNNLRDRRIFVATAQIDLVGEFINRNFSRIENLQVNIDNICLTQPINFRQYTLCLDFDPVTGEKIDVRKKRLTYRQLRGFREIWDTARYFFFYPVEDIDGKPPNRDGFPDIQYILFKENTSMAVKFDEIYPAYKETV